MFYKTSPFIIMIMMYALLAIIFMKGWIKVFKFKKIWYDNTKFIITSYFTKKAIEIPMSDITGIREVYGKLTHKHVIMYYKISFAYKNKSQYAFFYKSLDLLGVTDLENYSGLGKLK